MTTAKDWRRTPNLGAGDTRRSPFLEISLLSSLLGSFLLGCLGSQSASDSVAALSGGSFHKDDWQYIRADETRGKWGDFGEPKWLRYFGLAVGDLTGDGYLDIASGRYVYRNPGGDMSGPWVRKDLGENVDAILITDVDDDDRGDLIAQALPGIFWLEAEDNAGDAWSVRKVAVAPETGHVNSQGFALGQLVPGGKPEIVLASGEGIYYFEIPQAPSIAPWPGTLVTSEATDEGLDIADIDGDGLEDVVAAKGAKYVAWWRNPANKDKEWSRHIIGTTGPYDADRIKAADFDGDGRIDVAVTQERIHGNEPEASLYWFRQPKGSISDPWPRQRLLTEYSLNSLDAADIDRDGDIDLITAEHRGPHLRLQVLENDGGGNFLIREIDRGKESHLGALTADLDRDGDLDVVSIAWDRYQDLHIWRNDRSQTLTRVGWTELSNQTGAFAPAGVGAQSAALVFDVDKDGRDDFVIAGWAPETSMVWFRSGPDGLQRHLIDNRQSHIEAGGAAFDIDGDGDLDIVHGGSWKTNEVWWWENPFPNYTPTRPWERYTIKAWGKRQHHDQIVGDFDGDGLPELAFWNQQARKLFLGAVPDAPKDPTAWQIVPIWSWSSESNYEGLAKADVDLDGTIDLVGGGHWFRHIKSKEFEARTVDAKYGFSRSAVGDFMEGGRPEILLSSGDGIGPLNLYQWIEGAWKRSTLISRLDHGHTLQTGDINGDGHLDIYVAEMHTPGPASSCRQLLLYGDGRGGFHHQVLSTGSGSHESKLGDFDGDGDLDIMQKDFDSVRRVDLWINEGRMANGTGIRPSCDGCR